MPASSLSRRTANAHRHLKAENFFAARFPLHIMDVMQNAIEEHSHDFYEMVYVRRGCGEHRIGTRKYPIQAGDLYLIGPGEEHAYAPLPGRQMRIVNVLWMPHLIEDLLHPSQQNAAQETLKYIEPLLHSTSPGKRKSAQFAPRLQLNPSTAYRVETLLDEMRREQNAHAPGSEMLLRHLFCSLLVLLSRAWQEENAPSPTSASTCKARKDTPQVLADNREQPSRHGEAIARAIGWIEEHHAHSVRVCDVASVAALSPGRLAHVWKSHTGRGVIEYLHEYRVARAGRLLCETSRSAQEIAQSVGFNDARFFHRVFRRQTGYSPMQFRRHFGSKDFGSEQFSSEQL